MPYISVQRTCSNNILEKVVQQISSLHPAKPLIATKKTSLGFMHSCSLKSPSEQESKTYSPSTVRAVKVELCSSFDFDRSLCTVIFMCAARSCRCLAYRRSWTSRPFAVVNQTLSALPSPTRSGFSVRQPRKATSGYPP